MTQNQPQDGSFQGPWSPPPPPPARDPVAQARLFYAPWRRRVVAFLIDGLIVLIAGVVLRSAFGTPNVAPIGELLAVGLLQWMQSQTGATVGKRVLDMRLVDLRDGTPPTFVTCTCRWLLHFVDAIFLIGFLAPIVTRRKQTFSDKIARTVVVLG